MTIAELLQLLNDTLSTPSQTSPFIYYLLLVAFIFTLLRRWVSNSASSIPPSPPKLPIIGNLHQLSSLLHRDLQTFSKRCGPIMLLHFGSRPVLVVSSAEAASQILKTYDLVFSDRPKFIFFEKILYNYRDVVSAPYGEYWRRIKGICVEHVLNNKMIRSYHGVRVEETKLMMNNILESCTTSSVVNLSDMFLKLGNDIVCRIAMGKRYSDVKDEQGKMFMKIVGDISDIFRRLNIGDYIPWLSWISRLTGLEADFDDLAKRTDAFLDMVVQEHIDKSNCGSGQNDNQDQVMDFVDVLLSVQKENPAGISLDRVGIKGIILDIFAGGTDTTSIVLDWVMSELMRNPRVMKKVQNEVRTVVGNKQDITEEDLVGMHYLKAVIKETLRLRPPFPLLLPRSSRQDVMINGYSIKANTQVMVNVWAIGRDSKSYADPELFEPERFLNNSINYTGHDFELIPFGTGRRGCPGSTFAMAVVETVLANVLHKFDWELADGVRADDLDMSESTGVTVRRNDPLKLVAKPYYF